jgi:hypothetical protein
MDVSLWWVGVLFFLQTTYPPVSGNLSPLEKFFLGEWGGGVVGEWGGGVVG